MRPAATLIAIVLLAAAGLARAGETVARAGAGPGRSGARAAATMAAAESVSVTVIAPDEIADRLRRSVYRQRRQPEPVTANGRRTKAETILLDESFEESWPAAPWSITHPSHAADVDWGRTDHRASEASHSIWCAGAGADSPGAGGDAPVNTSSWTIAGPFDLTEATAGTLTFDLWLQTEAFQDLFMWLVSTDGRVFSGAARSTDTSGWKTVSVDLTDWGDSGDVTGEPLVWIAFLYQSDQSNAFEGAYVDNVVLIGDSGSTTDEGYTYTTDADFELGALLGLSISSDALALASGWTTFPYLWVPNSNTGTVSKMDTGNGNELARYRTGPARTLSPVTVAVDLDGACWVANRDAGTVVKIGLLEGDGCVDRDNDGTIDTSTDSDGDGNIGADEILAWGADECVLYEVVVVDGMEETYPPGTNHGDWSEVGVDGLAIDRGNNPWVGVSDSLTFYQIDGSSGEVLSSVAADQEVASLHGLVADKYGFLWAGTWPDRQVLRVDTASGEVTAIDLYHGAYGLGLDDANHLLVSGFTDSSLSQLNVSTSEEVWAMTADWEGAGVAATSNGDLWLASRGSARLTRYTVDGTFKAWVTLANLPVAMSVDASGYLWVVGAANDVVVRVNPGNNLADFQRELIDSGNREAAGDMTGTVAREITSDYGTWTVVYDSLGSDTSWGTLSWVGSEPGGTSIRVRVRSSNDQESWSSWEIATSEQPLHATPAGQYLQIEVAMQRRAGSGLPVLEELTVAPGEPAEARLRRGGGRLTP